MQPDQRIENEQARLARLDGVAEPFPVRWCIQSERRGGDDLDWQRLEADPICGEFGIDFIDSTMQPREARVADLCSLLRVNFA